MTNFAVYKFAVYFEPYRLDKNHVGQDIYKPVLVSRHRSKLAAARAIIRLITGTNPAARDYLASSHPIPIALRYVAWEIAESGRVVSKLSVRDLRS